MREGKRKEQIHTDRWNDMRENWVEIEREREKRGFYLRHRGRQRKRVIERLYN